MKNRSRRRENVRGGQPALKNVRAAASGKDSYQPPQWVS